jgi:membrane-bound ClpP family serine protease
VFLHGEIWDAVASSNIESGQRVVVRHLDGLRLHVDPAPAVPR